MFRVLSAMFVAVSLLVASSSDANAKRIRIPGGFSTESIELVLDLPDIPALKRTDGRYIDLGYRHTLTGGKWVGYIGSSSKYLPLPQGKLETLLLVAGVEKLPPVPSRPTSSWFWMLLALVGVAMIAWRILSPLLSRSASIVAQSDSSKVDVEQQQGNSWSAADDAMARAIAEKQGAFSGVTSTARTTIASDAPRASFGQRTR